MNCWDSIINLTVSVYLYSNCLASHVVTLVSISPGKQKWMDRLGRDPTVGGLIVICN